MVSLPSKIMSLSIGSFPNGLPVGPHPSLLSLSLSPTKILLGYLGSFRLPLLQCSSKLPVGSRSCWTFRNKRADSLAKTRALLPVTHVPCPRLLQRLDTLDTLRGDELFLTTPSPARFLLFPQRNWPFPVLSAVNCLDFVAAITTFICPLTYAR